MQHYIFGAGGHGKVVLDALRVNNLNCDGFIDDRIINNWCNLPVYQLTNLNVDTAKKIHLAIGNSIIRANIAQILDKKNISFFTIKHSNAVISANTIIEIGCFIAANAVIAPDTKIGSHTIINHGAVVDHDCKIGNFSHIAPRAVLGGGVCIGNNVLIGSGAVVLPGTTIGDNVTVGAGSIVTKNILTGLTVVGNPAYPIKR